MRDVACREHTGRRRTVAFQRAAKGVAAQAPRTSQEPRAFQPFDVALRAERNDDAGCGKSRDFEKMAMERARYRNEGHIRSMAYGRAPGDEWQRNDDQSTFSASCYAIPTSACATFSQDGTKWQ